MASPTGWTWVWASSGSWIWTGKPGVLQSMGSLTVGHNWATELNWNRREYWVQTLPTLTNEKVAFALRKTVTAWVLTPMWKCHSVSHTRLFLTPRSVSCQAPLSMGFNMHWIWWTGVGSHSLLRWSSWPRDLTRVFWIACRFFTIWSTWESLTAIWLSVNRKLLYKKGATLLSQ